MVPGQPIYLFGAQYPGGRALNLAAFTDPPTDPNTGIPLRRGHLGRNAVRGFGATQWWLRGEEDPDLVKREQYARWRDLRRIQEADDKTPTNILRSNRPVFIENKLVMNGGMEAR